MTIKSAFTGNHQQRLWVLIFEAPSLCSLTPAAHGSSSSRRILSFESDFATLQFFHQNEIDELGGKWQLQRGEDSHEAVRMGSRGHSVVALAHWAAQMSSGACSSAIFCASPSSSFLGRNLAKFDRMCIKYNQIKNGKKNQSQKVIWFVPNLDQVIIPAGAVSLVPQYRCCCKSCRRWHILILAMSRCGCCTIYVNFSILSIFSIASSPVSISSSSNSNSRPKGANWSAQAASGTSQLHQPAVGKAWIFLGLAGVSVSFSSSSLWFDHIHVNKIGTITQLGNATACTHCTKQRTTWLRRGT